MPTIAVDAMGGDFAPEAVVRGAARISTESNVDCLLVGDGYEEYGGSPLLGFERIFIKSHGRSSAGASASSIGMAAKAAGEDLSRQMVEILESSGLDTWMRERSRRRRIW